SRGDVEAVAVIHFQIEPGLRANTQSAAGAPAGAGVSLGNLVHTAGVEKWRELDVLPNPIEPFRLATERRRNPDLVLERPEASSESLVTPVPAHSLRAAQYRHLDQRRSGRSGSRMRGKMDLDALAPLLAERAGDGADPEFRKRIGERKPRFELWRDRNGAPQSQALGQSRETAA